MGTVKQDIPSRSETHGWVENSGYSGAEANRSERIARIIYDADDVMVVSSPVLTYDFTREVGESNTRCYVITSTERCLRLKPRGMLDKETFRLHGKTTNAISKIALVRLSGDIGAKVILADPQSDDCKGLFLTSDLTAKSMQCGQFLDVPLDLAEIREIWSIMRWGFWERATSEIVGESTKRCTPLKKFSRPNPARVLQSESRGGGAHGKSMGIIGDTASEVLVASTGLDENNPIARRLCELGRRGASVTLMTSTSCPTRACAMMNAANVRILGFSCFHANAIMSESGVLVASTGLAGGGRGAKLEIGLSLDGERAEDVRKTMQAWMGNHQYEFK